MVEDRIAQERARRSWNDAQRAAVIKETNRILAHPTFKTSNRCVALLRFLVDHALSGDEEGTKERTLGTEVFGRTATYDTNTDPIVRRTANEIRKRLAQCYSESNGRQEVTIHLQRGGYLPEFEFPSEESVSPVQVENSEEAQEPLQLAVGGAAHPKEGLRLVSKMPSRKWTFAVAAAVVVAFSSFLVLRMGLFSSPEDKVWQPILDSHAVVTVCLSDLASVAYGTGQSDAPASDNKPGTPQAAAAANIARYSSDTPFPDANVAHKISSWLSEHKIRTNLRPCSALQLQDFSRAPTVLVGGTNNPWALILLSKLSDSRFTMHTDSARQEKWIEDRQHPENRDWKIDGQLHENDVSVDYAVVTRFFNKESGQWIMAISGLQAHGTEAAGALVTDPAFANLLPSSLRSTGNFQLVLKASVIRGNTGPMQIVATYAW